MQFEKDGTNTLVFIYYAGHGIMENQTYIVCNSAEKIGWRYNIEANVRIIGSNQGTYCVAIFDCCREHFVTGSRGGAPGEEEEIDEDYRNCFITHGCGPNKGVDARSSIAVEYFKRLKKQAKPDGTTIIPGSLLKWTPGNGGEHGLLYQNDLKLKFLPGVL